MKSSKLFCEDISKLFQKLLTRFFNIHIINLDDCAGIDIFDNLNILLKHSNYDISLWQSFDPVYFEILDIKCNLSNQISLILCFHKQWVILCDNNDLGFSGMIASLNKKNNYLTIVV